MSIVKVCVFLVLCAIAGHAQVAISGQVVDQYGRPLPHAHIRVCSVTASGVPCTPTASIYMDYALTLPASNPYSADQYGNYTVYAGSLPAPNLYTVQVAPALGMTWSYVENGPSLSLSGGTLTGPLTATFFNATQFPYYEINGVQITSSALSDGPFARLAASNVFTGALQTAPAFRATNRFELGNSVPGSADIGKWRITQPGYTTLYFQSLSDNEAVTHDFMRVVRGTDGDPMSSTVVIPQGTNFTPSRIGFDLSSDEGNNFIYWGRDGSSANVPYLGIFSSPAPGNFSFDIGRVGAKNALVSAGQYNASAVNVTPWTTPAAPLVGVGGVFGTTAYSYVCVGKDWSGNHSAASPATTVTNATASLVPPNDIHIACSGNYPYWDIYRTAGGATQGKIGLNLRSYPYNTGGDSGILADGTIAPTTSTMLSGYMINGVPLAAENLSNGVSGTGAICLTSGSACSGFYQTVASNGTPQPQRASLNFVAPLSVTDSSSQTTVGLANSGVVAGSYAAANITVGSDGRLTGAANGTTAASSLVAVNGYASLPGGLILEWAQGAAVTTGDNTQDIILPLSFPISCLSVTTGTTLLSPTNITKSWGVNSCTVSAGITTVNVTLLRRGDEGTFSVAPTVWVIGH